MTAANWIVDALGQRRYDGAVTEASRRRLIVALGLDADERTSHEDMAFVAQALELAVFDLLDDERRIGDLREAAVRAFQIARVLPLPSDPLDAGTWLLHLGSLAVLGDRGADVRRILLADGLPDLPVVAPDWGVRVHASIVDAWLRLFRKDGWRDLDAIQLRVVALRQAQREYEPAYLRAAEDRKDAGPAWELMSLYHLAKAAEVLAVFLSQGSSDGRFDVRQQIEAQFDRAVTAAARGQLMALENVARLLARTAVLLIDNSIWTVTRAVNSRVTKFVHEVTCRDRNNPVFEMLPPQRRTLREEGLLGSAHRSVVVSLPTSSGKTLIAQFRILQALNQFDQERGWVAYLAPTRALVNQLTVRLRRDFGPLGIVVEKVSPALEVDGFEAAMLADTDQASQVRVLVTTPEKLDLMLRAGWEQRIGRPLTLVVVDEAHGIAARERGLRLELLLATINRECRNAQFLLLTPFIRNAGEIAHWLAPESSKNIEMGVDWSPNDRVVALSEPIRGKAGRYTLSFTTIHTNNGALNVPGALGVGAVRPLGLSWSEVSRGPGKLAAATADVLRQRGTVIILADKPQNTWGIAAAFKPKGASGVASPEAESVKRFLAHEMGKDFPLCDLLDFGVAVHHAGMSDDARALVEWLTEKGKISVLVATTTIAQGVNFPVSAIVFASHQYPYGEDMPAEHFWNIAGRAGRVDQGDLGVVALAATNNSKARKLRTFVARNVDDLSSTLVEMVRDAVQQGSLLDLASFSWKPEWSSFLQFLAHTYRHMDDHDRFTAEIEQVLRGTLGFQTIRRTNPLWASALITGVGNYAQRIRGKPLKLVDATGFSWETVSATLAKLHESRIPKDIWSPELFGGKQRHLQTMMGILLRVPELRKQLQEVTGGPTPDGDMLARVVCDWVQGRALDEMAKEYFRKEGDRIRDPVEAMTHCCRSVFGRLTQTASWGLAALQTLSLAGEFDKLSTEQQRTMRNLPARVYYGVNSDAAVTMRVLGVPRMAAQPIADKLDVRLDEPMSKLRLRLREKGPTVWTAAMGEVGVAYHHAWGIIEGEES